MSTAYLQLALNTTLTIIRCKERSFVYVVFNMDRLPVEYRRGHYLSIGSVDGQPVSWVVQL